MIRGNKPSGYLATIDNKVFGETRQCAHCQKTWIYIPGSGARRGVCLKCTGLLCGAKECMSACAPFSEIVEADDSRYTRIGNVFVKS